MQIVKLHKVEDEIMIPLPTSVVEALHLHEKDEVAIEVTGDRIILTPLTSNFEEAWDTYQRIEPCYHNANRKLAE